MLRRGQVLIVKNASLVMSKANISIDRVIETNSMRQIFLEAVDSVLPQKLVRNYVKYQGNQLIVGHRCYAIRQNVHMIGFGKAVLGMAVEVEKILKDHLRSGVISVPKDTLKTFEENDQFKLKENSVIRVYEGAENNLPDEDAMQGADAMIEAVKHLDESDILLVLISGGGSALFPKPRDGLSLEDKLTTMRLLTSYGANINELNVVRKKLSQVKGGGLAVLTYPVTTVTLILSDVVNDPLDVIASGPTVPNTDATDAAFKILKKYKLLNQIPETVLDIVKRDFSNPCIPIQPKGFAHVDNNLIGSNKISINRAKNCAEMLGYRTIVLSNMINSPIHTILDFYVNLSFEICKVLFTNDVDHFVSKINHMLKVCQYNFPQSLLEDLLVLMKLRDFCKGICIIAGGEITVQVKGSGIGGRNQELALLFSQKLFKLRENYPAYFKNFDVTLLSAGTDGIDGNSNAAGAIGCTNLIARAIDNYIDPAQYLLTNDSNSFFRLADKGANLITTGHTGTNVMDLHVICIRDVRQQ